MAAPQDFTPRYLGFPMDDYLQLTHGTPGRSGPVRDPRFGRGRRPMGYRTQFVRRKV